MLTLLVAQILLTAPAHAALFAFDPATSQPTQPASCEAVAQIIDEAKRLEGFVTSDLAKRFLAAASNLTDPRTRTLYYDIPNRKVSSSKPATTQPGGPAGQLVEEQRDAGFYYYTKYGTPLAYCRALDVIARAGFELKPGMRIFDFGYGGVGHLRLLASLGAEAVGVDVDPELAALYGQPMDQGRVAGFSGHDGSVKLVNGHWPGDADVRKSVGGLFDLIVSKNVLKRGYVHPERDVDPRYLVHLGVDDPAFLKAVAESLKPGGFFLIYNLYPKQNPPDKPYLAHADGRCPFAKEDIAAAGLRIISFDVNDDEPIRDMAHRLNWDDEGMNLTNDLFARYTIVRKPS